MKNEIIKLRNEGKTYNQISEITGLSKATISYHCKRNGVNDRIDGKGLNNKNIDEIKNFYREHTVKETLNKFNIGMWSLKKVVNRKNRELSDEEKKDYNYQHVKTFRKKNKERAIEYKGGKCQICGYCKCNNALEFHHINPLNKEFHISKNMNKSWKKIKNEIDKCLLVCANCHREIHEKNGV